MSRYDFDKIIDRRATNSLKWRTAEAELPMWVADMDFETAPEITAALAARVRHGVFGYETIPDAWYDAIGGWWETRHHFAIKRDWLMFCTGVVPAISAVIRKLSGSSAELSRFLREKTGLWLTAGTEYGENGEHFLRINIACPRSRLEDGLQRLNTGIIAYRGWMLSLR